MPRMARLVVPGYPHHVTQRGNRRQTTFFCDKDYQYYIELISAYTKKYDTEVWAYCLMPNHVHLVMVPRDENGLRAPLSEAHRRYTRYINVREDWRGHLWQERFHSFVMDEIYLLAAVRYVERNPIDANLCDSPFEWRWSSAAAHLKGVDDGLVKVAPMLDRVDDWHSYLSTAHDSVGETKLIERHGRTGRPLGDNRFIGMLEKISGRPLLPKRAGRIPAGDH